MTPTRTTTLPARETLLGRLAARESVLRLVALAASDPASARFERVLEPELQELACSAARHLAQDPAMREVELAPGEAPPASLDLGPLVAALRLPRERLMDDHTRLFGLVVSKECPPYEVQYCPQTFSVYRSQRLADIAGFYRAFGLTPGRDAPERADHIACELEFLTWLVAKERYALTRTEAPWPERAQVCREAQRSFVAEHLAWWVPAFGRALKDHARALDPLPPVAPALADVLAAWIPIERCLLGVEPPHELALPRTEAQADPEGCTGCST